MTIPPKEIRYRKSMAYFILAVSGFLFIMFPVMLFFSGAAQAGASVYTISFISMAIVAYISYRLYRKATSGEPVLVLSSDGLAIPSKNNRFISWTTITEWTIRKYKNSYTLIIYTAEQKTRIDITWLDQPVKEIEQLMRSYTRHI